MRTTKFILLLCMIVLGCKKTIETHDIIRDVQVNSTDIMADGSTVVTITAILNEDLNKRSIMFETDNGSFVDSPAGNSINVTATKLNDVLTAVAKLKAPSSSGTINIRVQPNILDAEGKYVVKKTINVSSSEPAKIVLAANSFSVYNNFDGEIELTGTLTNSKGNGVSKGRKVVIEDYDNNFNRISGVFRNQNLTTKTDSKVSVTYSPGQLVPNQYINLVASVLNEAGNKTAISDTVKVFITKKE